MAIEILQLNSDHEYQEAEFQLDGETFRLLSRYNERVDSWFLSLYDAEGNAIHTGRRVTVGNLMFPWLVSADRPSGQLIAIDSEDEDVDPGRDELGTRVVVYYFDAEEVEDAVAAFDAEA
ncbi:MAG: hypothetical protein IT381_28250 [Deltaproteobacteria bacterium]|nr:hypothetical protein [Deltaproteobacteria bacterium]